MSLVEDSSFKEIFSPPQFSINRWQLEQPQDWLKMEVGKVFDNRRMVSKIYDDNVSFGERLKSPSHTWGDTSQFQAAVEGSGIVSGHENSIQRLLNQSHDIMFPKLQNVLV